MSLKWQLDDAKPAPNEDGGPVLPDIAERAEEIIPVQHPSSVALPSRLAASSIRNGHVTELSF
jgi:hypothetical protein